MSSSIWRPNICLQVPTLISCVHFSCIHEFHSETDKHTCYDDDDIKIYACIREGKKVVLKSQGSEGPQTQLSLRAPKPLRPNFLSLRLSPSLCPCLSLCLSVSLSLCLSLGCRIPSLSATAPHHNIFNVWNCPNHTVLLELAPQPYVFCVFEGGMAIVCEVR